MRVIDFRRFKHNEVIPKQGLIPTTNGAILGFSFRQLVNTATYSIRQYSNDLSTFQDVGFINGYIDYTSILSFANGATTSYEMYNQFDNTLRYVKFSTFPLPLITSEGNLILSNNKVSGLFGSVDSRLRADSISLGSNVATFQVNDGGNDVYYQKMLNSISSGWIGVMQNNQTTSAHSVGGSPTFWKNQVQIDPVNRQILYNELNPTRSQHTIRDLGLSTNTLIKGYNVGGGYPPLRHSNEELWYDQSVMTAQEISDIETNQMDFYL